MKNTLRWFIGGLFALLFVAGLKAQAHTFQIPSVTETIYVPELKLTGYWDFSDGGFPNWVSVTYLGYGERSVGQPPSTLTINTDGRNITGVTWTSPVSIPSWLNGMMHNPDWLMPEIDDQDGRVFTPDLAFEFVPALRQVAPPLVKAVVKRGGKWIPLGILISDTLSREEAGALIETHLLDVAQQLMLRRQNPREVFSGIVYDKLEYSGRRIYTGKARGWGTPDIVMRNRDYGHAVDRPGFLPGTIQAWVITRMPGIPTNRATRGREQQAIRFQQVRLRSANLINSVAATNPNGFSYHLTSLAAWPAQGEIHPFEGTLRSGVPVWPPVDLVTFPFSRQPLGLGL